MTFTHLLTPEIQANAARNKALIAASFRDGPTFRMGFDAHVRAWAKAKGHEAFVLYQRDPEFAAAYDNERQRRRDMPMPAWGRREYS